MKNKLFLPIHEEEKKKEEEKTKEDPTRKAVIPMITIDELKERLKEYKTSEFDNDDLIRQALSLLHEWGEIVYFSSPPSLSNIIILDPKFLTKGILADLFRSEQNISSKRKDGIIYHKDLVYFWTQFKDQGRDFNSLASTFLSLLEKFGVCFIVEEDKPFLDQKSIIPSLLP